MPSFSLSTQEQIQIAIALQQRKEKLAQIIEGISPDETKDAEFFGDAFLHTCSALDTLDKMIR